MLTTNSCCFMWSLWGGTFVDDLLVLSLTQEQLMMLQENLQKQVTGVREEGMRRSGNVWEEVICFALSVTCVVAGVRVQGWGFVCAWMGVCWAEAVLNHCMYSPTRSTVLEDPWYPEHPVEYTLTRTVNCGHSWNDWRYVLMGEVWKYTTEC